MDIKYVASRNLGLLQLRNAVKQGERELVYHTEKDL